MRRGFAEPNQFRAEIGDALSLSEALAQMESKLPSE
jgi:hypothetical protein